MIVGVKLRFLELRNSNRRVYRLFTSCILARDAPLGCTMGYFSTLGALDFCRERSVRGAQALTAQDLMRNARSRLQLPNNSQMAQEIARISGLDLAGVRALWRTTFRKEPPAALTRDLLVRQLAWRIQEKAFGGHDAATLRLLDAYGRQDADKVVLFRRLKPGTSVVREYQGVRHIVTITEGGFVWQGKTYDSLSAIAREITGARWNGPRFFGLRAGDSTAPVRKTG